jgi:tripartite-type tricarboxylate transporter receptor subunit TctC
MFDPSGVRNFPRRQVLRAVAATGLALTTALAPGVAVAQDNFPSKPVRILVGSQAGGGVDAFSRIIAQKLQELWGQPVTVENRTGASGSIAADAIAKGAADGYTVVMATPNSHTTGPHVLKFPYDALRDFAPIIHVMDVPTVLVVSQALAPNNMKELVDHLKANAGKLSYYSSGIGSIQHLAGEQFKLKAGVNVVHIPYRGSAPAIADVIGGTVTLGFDPTSATLSFIQGGKLKALAVAAPTRAKSLPNVPTTAEAGYPGVEMATWYGLLGAPGTSRAVIDKWNRDVQRVIAMPDVAQKIAAVGAEVRGGAPEAFGAFLRDQHTKMGSLVKEANVRADN